ncbi:mannosyltransferase [Polaribacter sp.]|uniref:mannosyltransferase n=1 Tax=Polaribacter sp. TaxID=1920175 RepID=UPI003436C150
MCIAFVFRLIFLFVAPNLSQDFFRFIWDGRLLLEGINPYLSLPESLIQNIKYPIADARELYKGMGELNGSHYTNYPPLNQLCFLIAALFASKSIFGSVLVLRALIILAELGIFYFGKKLLQALDLPKHNIFWYTLNPFIIIELTGNLHFESVMLFFFIWGMYLLQKRKWILAGVLIGCSISVKLLPFLFLPLFFKLFIHKKSNLSLAKQWLQLIVFNLIILVTVIIFSLPFLSENLISNYANSVGLWFGKFEFNASFYYLFRAIGYWFRGYNEIEIITKITPILTILYFIYLTFFKKNNQHKVLFISMLFGLCFYYFTSTTIHPWYLATPLLLSIFTKYKFPVFWTLVIILSYQAYANLPWQENLWFVALEYILLFSFMIFEYKTQNKKRNIIFK